MNSERLLNTFLKLLEFNAPPRKEGAIADYLENLLQEVGVETFRDSAGEKVGGETGNIIGRLKGNCPKAPSLLLSAHMDTVEPTEGLKVQVEEGWIKTDGSTILGADDRAGLAVIIEAVRTVIEEGLPHGDLEIAFSICEEIGLYGARYMDFSLLQSRLAYVFDSGRPVAGIINSAPWHRRLTFCYKGKASHAAAAPEQGINAILAGARAISVLPWGRLDEETTANVGVIQGGKATNIVPETLEVKAEARSRDPEKLEKVVQNMIKAFEIGAFSVGAEVKVEQEYLYKGYFIPEDHPLIQWAVEVHRNLDLETVIKPGSGGSDANIFNERGITSVVIGLGYQDVHSVDERIAIADLETSARFAIGLIQQVAQQSGPLP